MRLRALRLSSLLAATVLLTACGASDPAGSASGGGGEPRSGGNLEFLIFNDQGSLDPAAPGLSFSPASGAPLNFSVYDSLVRVDADGAIEPRLATSVESKDAVHWKIDLRDGVKFTDGTPLDAEAVKFNWERHRDPAAVSGCMRNVKDISEIDVTGPLSLDVTLAAPNVAFSRSLMDTCLGMIGSPTAIKADPEGFAKAPVAAGPFSVSEWVTDDHLTLKRNPDFWDAPRPYVEEVQFRFIPDDAQRAETFRSGGGDVAAFPTPGSQVKLLQEEGYEATAEPGMWGGFVYAMNLKKPPLDDARVRRAFSLAIDLDRLNDVAFGGVGLPPRTIFPKGSPFHEDIPLPVGDPAEAQKELDSYIAEKGGPVRVTILTNPSLVTGAEAVAQMVNQVRGFEVKLESIGSQENAQRRNTHNYEVTAGGITGIDPEPLFFDGFSSGGSYNWMSYSNAVVDEALKVGRSSQDPQERAAAYRTAQEQIAKDAPLVFLSTNPYYSFADKHVRDYGVFAGGYVDLSKAWLDE